MSLLSLYCTRICSFISFSKEQAARFITTSKLMANSKYDYVKQFEQNDSCLPNSWIIIRVDGKGFHKFSKRHTFTKPNDDRSLNLMTTAARAVLEEFTDIVIAYGQSDEYSFVFCKETQTYNRRASKLMTNVTSLFTSAYVYSWASYFPNEKLQYPPSFDGRVVLYPSNQNMRDYLSWRQVDCHINNLYNTVFWTLIQEGGLSPQEAQCRLKGTYSSDKHEILFSEFNLNYNNMPELHKKGTTLLRAKCDKEASDEDLQVNQGGKQKKNGVPRKWQILQGNFDIIKDIFWKEHPEILRDDL